MPIDEFTDEDTCVANLATQGQMRQIRVFSQSGCYRLGFFAKTPLSKELLDIGNPSQAVS